MASHGQDCRHKEEEVLLQKGRGSWEDLQTPRVLPAGPYNGHKQERALYRPLHIPVPVDVFFINFLGRKLIGISQPPFPSL